MRFVFLVTGVLVAVLLVNSSALATSSGESLAPTPLNAVPAQQQTQGEALVPQSAAIPQQQGTLLRVDEFQHWSGNIYRLKNFDTRVIRSKEEWEDFWYQTKQTPPSDLPRGKMAAVIVLGLRPNSDYNVRVVEIRRTDDDFMVSYIENKSSRANVSSNRSTTGIVPWVVQLLPFTDGRVRFRQVNAGN